MEKLDKEQSCTNICEVIDKVNEIVKWINEHEMQLTRVRRLLKTIGEIEIPKKMVRR